MVWQIGLAGGEHVVIDLVPLPETALNAAYPAPPTMTITTTITTMAIVIDIPLRRSRTDPPAEVSFSLDMNPLTFPKGESPHPRPDALTR